MEQMSWKPFTADARQAQLATVPEKVTTFRKGTKWLRPELVGTRVEFFDEGNKRVFAQATVLAVKTCRWKDIDAVDNERQSSDMTADARLEVMRKVYGAYDDETITTVVTLGEIELK